jgi:hypothetical protein
VTTPARRPVYRVRFPAPEAPDGTLLEYRVWSFAQRRWAFARAPGEYMLCQASYGLLVTDINNDRVPVHDCRFKVLMVSPSGSGDAVTSERDFVGAPPAEIVSAACRCLHLWEAPDS